MSILQVDLNSPGGTQRHPPLLLTTTLVWYVPSNFSSALQIRKYRCIFAALAKHSGRSYKSRCILLFHSPLVPVSLIYGPDDRSGPNVILSTSQSSNTIGKKCGWNEKLCRVKAKLCQKQNRMETRIGMTLKLG